MRGAAPHPSGAPAPDQLSPWTTLCPDSVYSSTHSLSGAPLTLWPVQYLAYLAYLAYNVPWPTYILFVKSSQVNDM